MENDTDRTESDLGKFSNFHYFHQAAAMSTFSPSWIIKFLTPVVRLLDSIPDVAH